jgi:fructose 1,6-bisphosphate aldolase/phosphatase
MKTTLSIIKADIGSIGGHIRPSERLIAEVKNYVGTKGKGLITDFFMITGSYYFFLLNLV